MKKKEKNPSVETVAEEKVTAPAQEAMIDDPSLTEYDHKWIDKDIKFRGPLSYRYLRIIAWVSMAVTFCLTIVSFIFNIKATLSDGLTPGQIQAYETISIVYTFFSMIYLPLFLIANFAVILQHKNNYLKLIKLYGKLLLIIYVAFLFVYYHYIVIILMRAEDVSFGEARALSIDLFTSLGKQNGMVVNTFVDLFMCVLIMFFIDYKPKKHFQGNKIIIFRLLVLIPILYEVMSGVFAGLLGMNKFITDFRFSLPPEILPLLGKKPIGMIISFVLICLFIKLREKHFLRKGGTEKGYELYSSTNKNSLMLSIVMSVIFLVIAIIDVFAIFIPVLAYANNGSIDGALSLMDVLLSFGLGKSICLILVIPFVMLFSYSKVHNNPKFDKLIPFIGIGLIIFSIIETLFFTLLF